jgi:3-isopropylmalate dehydrogenase
MKTYRIVALPGDGIGPEIVDCGLAVARAAAERFGFALEVTARPAGGAAIDAFGTPLPDETLELCRKADAILKGPFGGPKWDGLTGDKRAEAGILKLRKELDLFANLRPVKDYPALRDASPLKPEVVAGTDMLIFRELTGGLYFGTPRGSRPLADGTPAAVNTMEYTRPQVERIARSAFEAARRRRRKVTNVDKFNVLEVSRFWQDIVKEVAKGYPDVTLEHLIVDNAAMQLVRRPADFDVLLTENMFGDILSDEASVVVGSLGMQPSASLGAGVGLYEPIHGSAPDIVGKGIANPVSCILSVAMMLEHAFGRPEAARAVDAAVTSAVEAGVRTSDIAGKSHKPVTTAEMTAEIVRRVKG